MSVINRLEYVETALDDFLQANMPALVTTQAAVSPSTSMGSTLTAANFTRGQTRINKWPAIHASALRITEEDRTADIWLVSAQVFVTLDIKRLAGNLEEAIRVLQRYEQVIAEVLRDTSSGVQGQRLGGSAGIIDARGMSSQIDADFATVGAALQPVGATLTVDIDVLLDSKIVV